MTSTYAKFEGLGDLVVITIVLILAAGIGVSLASSGSRVKCESLRDHLVELRLAQATNVARTAHREAMRKALDDTFVTDCQSKLSPSEVDCALNATDTAAAAACSAATE